MKKQHYMTEKERYKLEAHLESGKSVSWIAKAMGFCRQTIYNEIKRGTYFHTVRRWFPKGTVFEKVSKTEIAAVQDWMNNYPRKILGWATPNEAIA